MNFFHGRLPLLNLIHNLIIMMIYETFRLSLRPSIILIYYFPILLENKSQVY